MSIDRIVLAVLTAFILLAGVGCLVAPASFAEQIPIQPRPGTLTEIRAFYGGLQIGVGAYLVWCLRDPARTFQGLLLVGLAVGSAGLARAFGIFFDGAPSVHHFANLGIEIVTVVLVALALSSLRRRSANSGIG